MVEAEVVGRGSHHAKTNDGCRRDSAGLLVLQNCLLSTLPVQGPAFFRRPNKTIISSPWGLNEAAKLAGAKARRLVVLGGPPIGIAPQNQHRLSAARVEWIVNLRER